MVEALDAGVELYRLTTAERVLLEQTLHGSIKALTDILALANPIAFGRATRVRQYVMEMLDQLGVQERWPIEVAAMISQIALVSLPPEVLSKYHHGRPLTEIEKSMIQRLPEITEDILANIPRLEPVREILRHQETRFEGPGALRGERIPLGARLLKVALDLVALESAGVDLPSALVRLHQRRGWYDPHLLETLNQARRTAQFRERRLSLPVSELRQGMILEQDVLTRSGAVIVAKGLDVTRSLLERLSNFAENAGVHEPIEVRVPVDAAEGQEADAEDETGAP